MNHALIFSVHNLGLRRLAGPYRIASFLREHDWDVEVIDYVKIFTLEQLKEVVRMRVSSNTVFIGFSSFFNAWSNDIDAFVDWIKIAYPNVKIIMGGQSKPIINTKGIDYYIHGYGEYAILELTKSLVGNSSNKIIFDPLFFGSKKVISANKHYPAFPLSSLKIKYEDRDYIQPWEWLTVECARGCIFQCPYCNFPILGVREDHTRSADDFEVEMRENYERWGVKNYYIADETFNDYSEKIEKYANAISRTNIKTVFSGFIRADLMVARPQDWSALATMGFFGHFYGIETMNYESAKVIGKGMNIDKLKQGLLDARKFFKSKGPYRGAMGIVVGLPHETIESQMNTFEWLEDNWQGEAVHPWPLDIQKSELTDVTSKMGQDYKKYGYRESTEMPDPPPPETLFFGNPEGRANQAISHVIWENDNMNLKTASKMVDDFMLRMARRETFFGISMWAMSDYTYPNIDLQYALDTYHYYDIPINTTSEREQEYIKLKLR